MAWTTKYPIDYTPNGDDIDALTQKYMSEIQTIYALLDRLRKLDSSSGTTLDDVEAYQLKINQTTNDILIRNGTNDAWIILGKMATNFGITPELISAMRGKGSIAVGLLAERPININSNEGDIYITLEGDMYYFKNDAWNMLLTMNVENLHNYGTLITKDMISCTNAPDKILKTDAAGMLDTSIKGNAQGLVSYPLDTSNIGDGKVIAYSKANGKLYFEVAGANSGGGSAVGVITGRENLKDYPIGAMVYSSRLPSGTFLKAVKAGKTDEFQPDYGASVNGFIVDGTVLWRRETLSGINFQINSDEPPNQLPGDVLINVTSTNADGGKNAILKVKKDADTYENIYLESDNREMIEATGYGIINGLEVNAQAVPDFTVRVTAGIAHMPNGKRFEVAVNPSIALVAADSTANRKDLLYLSAVGKVEYLPGELASAAIAGKRDYPIAVNAVAGNAITIGAVTITAGTDFAVGETLSKTAANIAAALNANTTITSVYEVSTYNNIFTLTEKIAGTGNTSPVAVTTGDIKITDTTPEESKASIYNEPVLPANALALAMLTIKARQDIITADDVLDMRIMKQDTKSIVEAHDINPTAHEDIRQLIKDTIASIDLTPYSPTASITAYAGNTAPNGWLLCQGQAVSRTMYAKLFAIIGTMYGVGDSSTTFNIPDLRSRTIVGLDNNDTDFASSGKAGGEKNHTLTVPELAAHGHTGTGWTDSQGLHEHRPQKIYSGNKDQKQQPPWEYFQPLINAFNGYVGGDYYSWGRDNNGTYRLPVDGQHTHNVGINVANTGGNQPHNNMQPYMVCNYIIKY